MAKKQSFLKRLFHHQHNDDYMAHKSNQPSQKHSMLQILYAKNFKNQQRKLKYLDHHKNSHKIVINPLQIFIDKHLNNTLLSYIKKHNQQQTLIMKQKDFATLWHSYLQTKKRILIEICSHVQDCNIFDIASLSTIIDHFYNSCGILNYVHNTNSNISLAPNINKIKVMNNSDWPTYYDLLNYINNNVLGNKYIYNQNFMHRVANVLNSLQTHSTYTRNITTKQVLQQLK